MKCAKLLFLLLWILITLSDNAYCGNEKPFMDAEPNPVQVVKIEIAMRNVQQPASSASGFCSGTVFNQSIVMTASHCFLDGVVDSIMVYADNTQTAEGDVSSVASFSNQVDFVRFTILPNQEILHFEHTGDYAFF